MECSGLHNKPQAEVHPVLKLTGPKEEEEEEEEEEETPLLNVIRTCFCMARHSLISLPRM
jgi:CO dehydrogenase/acetyl-CoA synthase beta subunit